MRISAAPPKSKQIPNDHPVEVRVISVRADDELGEKLVKIYKENPSPYVSGPTTLKKLANELAKGTRFFLVSNGEGDIVGARAFEPDTKRLVGSVTDFPFRGKGYQFSAAAIVRKSLAEEGFREFHGEIMKDNTRQVRTLIAQGWKIRPHPTKPHIICGILRVDDEI